MTAEQRAETEIRQSYFSIFSKSTIWALVYSQGRLTHNAAEAKYKGFEVVPTNLTISGVQLKSGRVEQATLGFIKSAHESPHINQTFSQARKRSEIPWWLVFEDKQDSFRDILLLQERLRKELNQELPIVFYEGSQEDFGTLHEDSKLVQPHPGLIQYLQATNTQELIDRALEQGFTDFCLDLHHMRRENTFLANWQESLPLLLPHTKQLHVAVGRFDSPDPNINTMAELEDLSNGTKQTEVSKMLIYIGKHWKGPVVTEIPGDAFAHAQSTGVKSRFISPRKFVEINKRIVENVGDLLNN